MAGDEQDELPEATQREAELQRQIAGLQSQVKLFHIWKYGRFSLSDVFHFLEGSRVQGPSPGFPLVETRGTHLSGIRGSESCLEAGGKNTRIFSPTVCPLFLDFCRRSRGITCALKSTGSELILNLDKDRSLRVQSIYDSNFGYLPGNDKAGASSCDSRASLRQLSILLSLYSGSLKMKSEPDLASGSSSIGVRVRSRRKIGDEVCESMNSSGSFLGLSAEIEEIKNAAMGETSPLPEGGGSLLVGPVSEIGVEEVAFWRQKFHLSENLVNRIPGPFDMVSDFRSGEVPVYEGFFESGFRDQVSSLIAKVSRAVNISPGQLNPPALRILIVMQNLGDLEGLVIGAAEVLYCYSVSPLNGGERRYHLHPRSRMLPVQELSRSEKKHHPVCEGNWHQNISRADFSSGRHVIEQLLGLPVDRREISFLVSEEVLDRCSIRGVISDPRGAEALEEYKRALEVTAARKAAIHRVVPAGGSNIQFTRSGKRQAAPIVAPSSSKKRSRASVFKPSLSASRSCSKALASLNSEVFPMTPTRPSLDEDTSKVVRSLQGDVLQVASQLFHLKGRMKNTSATKAERDALAIRLREEKDAILAKDEEIEAWKLRRRLENKEEEICELRYAAEVFDAEKIKTVNDAKVVVCWELMREWLDDQTDRWDPITSFEQYKVVKISEAEFLGLPLPSFETQGSWVSTRTSGLYNDRTLKPLSVLEGAGLGENPSARLTLVSTRMSSLEGSFILCRVLHLFESRDLVWELFHAPALADLYVVDVRGPLSPISASMKHVVAFIHWSKWGPNPGFLLVGTRGTHLSGIRGSESCLEAGGKNTGIFFPNSLPLISRLCHRSQGITCTLKSTGVAHSQQAPVPLKSELILNLGKDRSLRVQSISNSIFFCLSENGETGADFHFGVPLDRGGERKCDIFPVFSPVARNSSEDLEISDFLFPGSKKGKS
ncbi:hypothetical protein IGI04_030348 [Brassica rapa subsp. trilocularis]|uniref:Uncharacterized protein n=1 Tax=Brassica rapa subsp. trilocularis TaxID=1813537 RepID=A0ABQ7LQH8_BRACM|nr:hypothetical protein IGI04_030348 [Brassica rapa subsp. trilocularis]